MSGKLGGPDDGKQYRRVSSPLSPIFYLFLAPSGKLYQKLQRFLTEEEQSAANDPPVLEKQQRPGPRNPAYGLPSSEWSTVLRRVLEKKEPLRNVANDYGVSHETVRRLIRASRKLRTS